MAEFDFLENPRLMRVPTKTWLEKPCERILVPDRDFVYMLEIQDVPVRARDKFIHWRMMTAEEEQTFKQCEHERFWTRSVPFMIGVSAITAVLSRRARYNLWQKAICQYAALTVGRDLGHFTYWYLEHERWAERFMHLRESTYGEALRRRDCQVHRWYPNGVPPIPRELLYTRRETPASVPPPPPPFPSKPASLASSQPQEEAAEFPSDTDEKYSDYSFEYNSPFISSLAISTDSDENETTVQQGQKDPELSISCDENDESVPSSLSPLYASSSPSAFPSSSPSAFPSAFPSSSPPAFPSSSPSAFPSSSPPAFPSSSPPVFPSSSVNWEEDAATIHEENLLLSNDSVIEADNTEDATEDKDKKRNIYGDIIEEDIQQER